MLIVIGRIVEPMLPRIPDGPAWEVEGLDGTDAAVEVGRGIALGVPETAVARVHSVSELRSEHRQYCSAAAARADS
jgi:hypothetical protein